MQSAHCLITGDSTVGKSHLLFGYTQNGNPDEPDVYNNSHAHITVEGRTVELGLWDFIALEEYSNVRLHFYQKASVVIICFSVGSSVSYENVTLRWYPEARQYCPNVPILLVGTKKDLRHPPEGITNAENANQVFITTEQGTNLAKEIGALKYLECSALNQEGLKEVFEEAARAVLGPIPKKSKSVCHLM